MKLPKEGDFITIQSYKHDGSLHRTWRDTMVLKTTENAIIGVNDHTLVTESDGRRWVTREPAIVYFHKKYWFNIIAMIRDNGISYYCNMASPYYLDEEALKYIDYDLDVKIFTDGEIGHGANLTASIRTLLGYDTPLLRKDGGLANASVTIVETEDFKNFNLLVWNDTSYQN